MNLKLIYLGVLILAISLLFGCTDSDMVLPYTSSQFVAQSTDLNYDLFKSGDYNNMLLVFDGNKISVADANDLNVGIDLTGYVPYTGATSDVDLGEHQLTATNVTANGAVYITPATGYIEFLGETAGIVKSNSGIISFDDEDVYTDSSMNAASFVTTGGTSNDFVKGDGSLDSGTYLTSVNWGDIAGAIGDQTDLQEELDNKINLDQTSPQDIINGAPYFNEGIFVSDADGDASITYDSGTGMIEVSKDLLLNGDLTFENNSLIKINTDDGSDNGYLTLTGGGGSGTTRGAIWQLFGNETIANAGSHIISLGNVAGANLNVLDKDSTTRFFLDENGIKLSTTGTQVNSILDEDNMASDSATALATQQSIKAYVDSQAGGYDNLTDFVDQTPWRMFYSNTDGDVTELAFGDSGKVLQSNGASAAPTWETPSGGSVSFGSEGEIPYTNATTDDFNYSNKFTFGQSLALTPSLQMSGNANEYARIPNTEQILTNQFSISAWFLADSSSTGYLGLISKRPLTAENILLRINGSGGANDGKMEFVGISQTITSANSVRDGNWHHVVVRRDGSNVISMWIDGVQQATTYTAATNYTSTSNWHFGRSYSNTTTEVWDGQFQQTVLWVGSSLSNNDIADIYNSGVGLYMNLSTTLPTDSTAVSTNCKWFLPWEGFAGDIGPSQYAVTSNFLTFPNFVTGHVPYPSFNVLDVNGYVTANGFCTRTEVNSDENALEEMKLGNELLNADGTINHSAFGQCYLKTVTGEEALKIDCYIAQMAQALALINKAMNVGEESIDTGTLLTNAIYTKSRVPEPQINYCKLMSDSNIYDKENHYAFREINGKYVLDAEYRWVVMEGCIKQQETCGRIAGDSFKKYGQCMGWYE